MVLLVLCGHVRCNGCHAMAMFSRMTGDALIVEEDLNEFVFGMDLQFFTNKLMRHRVKVIFILNVVIHIHFDCFDMGIFIRMFG